MNHTGVGLYFTYEARLASFQKATKKRGSTAGGRAAKALKWPHKQIPAVSLARAGFVFRPSPESPDNTVCFLCEKGLDGWEAGDDPLYEHLKHAPHCGWAVVAAIEADIGDYGKEDPNHPDMIEARKATFADSWPHDSKKGWKCKSKQLVEAGWKYTPTSDSDDMATCTYCQLALDGWERNDKPFDEHYNRSPDCTFFSLVSQYKAMGTTYSRGKASRTSKASRMSVQSVGTIASETTALTDMTTGPEDSILTVASTATQQGTKKAKAKRGAATKGGRKKTKKDEQSEIHEISHQVEDEPVAQSPPKQPTKAKRVNKETKEQSQDFNNEFEAVSSPQPPPKTKKGKKQASSPAQEASVAVEKEVSILQPPSQPLKAKRGKKRSSEATDESDLIIQEGPPAKKRASRLLVSNKPDDSIAVQEDNTEMTDVSAPKPPRKKKDRLAGSSSTVSTTLDSNASMASLRAAPGSFPDDDEIERQLEEDLARQFSDDEEIAYDSDFERMKAKAKQTMGKPPRVEAKAESVEKSRDYAMFDPEVPKSDEDAIDDELRALQAEMGVDELQQQQPDAKEDSKIMAPPAKRGRGRPAKASVASQSADDESVVRTASQPAKKPRGRPSKASLDVPTSSSSISREKSEETPEPEAQAKRSRGRPPKKSLESKASEEPAGETEIGMPQADFEIHQPPEEPVVPPVPAAQSLELPSSTPVKIVSPAPSARQPVLSPSPSPQSSDAENQPPSARPPATATMKRVVLAPVSATPTRGSPSRRNIIGGLRSTTPWTAADIEAVFGSPRHSPGKENGGDVYLKQGKDLTSAVKGMTVEEWVYYNASEAEKRLKHECESMVNRFEREGTRAIQVLEGLEVE